MRLSPEQTALISALEHASQRDGLLPGVGALVRYRGLGLWGIGEAERRWTTGTVRALERLGLLREAGPNALEYTRSTVDRIPADPGGAARGAEFGGT